VPSLELASLPHRGPYLEIGKAFDMLYGTLGARNLIRPGLRSIAIYLDDPTAVPAAELRSHAGVVIEAGFPVAPPLERIAIPGGPCAVLGHRGPYADMKAAYDWLFGSWLVGSGREVADAPVFEEYLNSPRDTAPPQLRTDIYLPLK